MENLDASHLHWLTSGSDSVIIWRWCSTGCVRCSLSLSMDLKERVDAELTFSDLLIVIVD